MFLYTSQDICYADVQPGGSIQDKSKFLRSLSLLFKTAITLSTCRETCRSFKLFGRLVFGENSMPNKFSTEFAVELRYLCEFMALPMRSRRMSYLRLIFRVQLKLVSGILHIIRQAVSGKFKHKTTILLSRASVLCEINK